MSSNWRKGKLGAIAEERFPNTHHGTNGNKYSDQPIIGTGLRPERPHGELDGSNGCRSEPQWEEKKQYNQKEEQTGQVARCIR